MQILQTLLVVLFFLCCAVLVFLILIQSGKGGSMGIMGGGGSTSTFGSSTVDVVEKATWWGIATFLILAILSAVAFADGGIKLNEPVTEPTPITETENGQNQSDLNTNPGQNTIPNQNGPVTP